MLYAIRDTGSKYVSFWILISFPLLRGSIIVFGETTIASETGCPKILGFSNLIACPPIKFNKASVAYCCLIGKVLSPGLS